MNESSEPDFYLTERCLRHLGCLILVAPVEFCRVRLVVHVLSPEAPEESERSEATAASLSQEEAKGKTSR